MDEQTEEVSVNGAPKLVKIITVSSARSAEFDYLKGTLGHTSVVGLDAEWKPQGDPKPKSTPAQPGFNGGTEVGSLDADGNPPETSPSHSNYGGTEVGSSEPKNEPKKKAPKTTPFVCVLQIACAPNTPDAESVVFLVDLVKIRREIEKKEKEEEEEEINSFIKEIYDLLKAMFEAPNIVKLGHGLETDMKNLSSSFQKEWKARAFDKVQPAVEIKNIYKKILSIRQRQTPGSAPKKDKETPGLNDMSKDILRLELDKVGNQTSNWEARPLNSEQKKYAALDVFCLIEILNVFRKEVPAQGVLSGEDVEAHKSSALGSPMHTIPLDIDLLSIVKEYGAPKEKKSQQPSGETKPRVARQWENCPKIVCVDEAVHLAEPLRNYGINTEIADGSSCIVDRIKKAAEENGVVLRLESLKDKPQKDKKLKIKRPFYMNFLDLKGGCQEDVQPITEMQVMHEDTILECSICTMDMSYAQVALIDGEDYPYCGTCKNYFNEDDIDLSKVLRKLYGININHTIIRKKYGRFSMAHWIEEFLKGKWGVIGLEDDCPMHKQCKKLCIDHQVAKTIKTLGLENYKYQEFRCTGCNKHIINPEEVYTIDPEVIYCTTCKDDYFKRYNRLVMCLMYKRCDELEDELDDKALLKDQKQREGSSSFSRFSSNQHTL